MNLLFLGFILAYNPVFSAFLMGNGAIGAISYRIATGSAFLGIIAYRLATRGVYWNRNERSPSLIVSGMLLLAVASAFTFVASLNGSVNWTYFAIDAFPICELVIVFFYARNCLVSEPDADLLRTLRRLGIYLAICGIANLLSYFILTALDVKFGALRAWVNGVTVNRLMDFVLPAILSTLLFGGGRLFRSALLQVFLTVLVLLVTALTFFRTVQVTVLITCLCAAAMLFRAPKALAAALVKCTSIALLAVTLLVVATGSTRLLNVFGDRVASAFTHESASENSQQGRLAQTAYLPAVISNFPFGHGFGSLTNDTPTSDMFNYFMQFGIIFGAFMLTIFIGLWLNVFASLFVLARRATNKLFQLAYVSSSLILIYLLLVINLFPYMIQFPVMYIAGVLMAVADRGLANERLQINRDTGAQNGSYPASTDDIGANCYL